LLVVIQNPPTLFVLDGLTFFPLVDPIPLILPFPPILTPSPLSSSFWLALDVNHIVRFGISTQTLPSLHQSIKSRVEQISSPPSETLMIMREESVSSTLIISICEGCQDPFIRFWGYFSSSDQEIEKENEEEWNTHYDSSSMEHKIDFDQSPSTPIRSQSKGGDGEDTGKDNNESGKLMCLGELDWTSFLPPFSQEMLDENDIDKIEATSHILWASNPFFITMHPGRGILIWHSGISTAPLQAIPFSHKSPFSPICLSKNLPPLSFHHPLPIVGENNSFQFLMVSLHNHSTTCSNHSSTPSSASSSDNEEVEEELTSSGRKKSKKKKNKSRRGKNRSNSGSQHYSRRSSR